MLSNSLIAPNTTLMEPANNVMLDYMLTLKAHAVLSQLIAFLLINKENVQFAILATLSTLKEHVSLFQKIVTPPTPTVFV